MSVVLGLKPDTLLVVLATGADFLCTLTLDSGDWPVGTTLSLDFEDGPTWTADITGPDAVFDEDKVDADAIAEGTVVKLVYTNGTTDQVWAVGEVARP